jgi:hypothetical protein
MDQTVIKEWIILGVAVGNFVITMALAYLTSRYVKLTHQLVKTQEEPYVVVYARHDESRPSIIQIIIENVGRGVAEDVRFKMSRKIPDHAFGIEVDSSKQPETMTSGPLIEGIPGLGPGDKRKITWGQYGGLSKGIGKDVITISTRCKYRGVEMIPVINVIDIKSFEGTDATDPDGARQSAKQLERIANILDKKLITPNKLG